MNSVELELIRAAHGGPGVVVVDSSSSGSGSGKALLTVSLQAYGL